ncbi:hypothetical protein BDV93DRAFT_521670 [Ceratobasidium sp. AG-I]|nr:hypothetical protein BDV93DRAFT_521670 [Ceratobasidium sp. AG-I]
MPPKRKRNQGDVDDDDAPALGNRVLPVADLPSDFSGEPEDGAQYLFLVRRDALSLPHTTRVFNPYETPIAPSVPSTHKPRHPCLPSEEWRLSFEETFKVFRQTWRAGKASQLPLKADSQTPKVPRPKDRGGWLEFINGTEKSAGKPKPVSFPPSTAFAPRSVLGKNAASPHTNPASEGQPSPFAASNIQAAGIVEDESSDTSSEEEPEEEQEPASREPRKPLPSIIKRMDDHGAIHLLMFIAYWIRNSLEGNTAPSQALSRPFHFPKHHQQWAFALLAQLDTSLRSEEISHLREVARACIAAIREDLALDGPVIVEADSGVELVDAASSSRTPVNPDSGNHNPRYDHLVGAWMVVGIIASVWGQRDMWQDAEETLADLVAVKPKRLSMQAKGTKPLPPTSKTPTLDRPDPEFDVELNYG